MKFQRHQRQLRVECLETKQLLAGDVAQTCAESPYLIGDANRDHQFDETDLVDVFQAGKYETGEIATWEEGDFNADGVFDSNDMIAALESGNYRAEPDEIRRQMWPEVIPLPAGFESEGIELGNGHDFFLSGVSWSGTGASAGAIYKGNLCTGDGEIIAEANGRPVAGLSYDARTDRLYGATGDPGAFLGIYSNRGVNIYDGTSGQLVEEIIFGDGSVTNDILVTKNAVFVTDSVNPALFKIPLDDHGQRAGAWETIELSDDFVMNREGAGFNANGLVSGDDDGDELVIINGATGVLYHVDTNTGESTPLTIQGEEQRFVNGDGLFIDERTLYVMQNFQNKIAVIQLSEDLRHGDFVKNITSNHFAIPTTIRGFEDSIYAINTHFCEITPICGADPQTLDPLNAQTEVVRVGT